MKKEKFTIIHIASHGKFENEPKNSFVLTYDQKLTMDHLRELMELFQFRKVPIYFFEALYGGPFFPEFPGKQPAQNC